LKQAVPRSRYLLFFSVALVGCAIDLASKSWAFAHLGLPGPDGRTWWLWPDVFGFQTSLNEGALFGLGRGYWPLFAGLSVAAAVGIMAWLFIAGAARDGLLTTSLALITAGILGNLYDRLGVPGLAVNGQTLHAVRDFILVMIGRWPWPTFNLADSSLVCGAGLLMWHAFFCPTDAAATDAQQSASSSETRPEDAGT
jgi:signal peptidase II